MAKWKEYKFSELCSITRGASPRPIQEFIADNGMPWVKISDATENETRFISKTKEFIKSDGVKKSKIVYPGDLVLSNSATPGIPKFMEIQACIHDGWLLLRDFKNLDKNFAYWLLINERQALLAQGNGSIFTNLKTDILKNHIIKIPNIEIQKEIANKLNLIQEKMELNTQTNQTLEAIAQAIFKSWFVDFDPVRAKASTLSEGKSEHEANLAAMSVICGKDTSELNDTEYKALWQIAEAFPSELVENEQFGEVPKGWEIKSLDEIANYQNGLALQKFRPKNNEDFLPVVKIAQLRQGYADGEEKASADIKPECIIDNGDIIFSWSGTLMVDIWCGGKAALNQHLFKVTSNHYPKWFYYLWTKYHLVEFQRIAADKAVTMGHIKREHLSQALCAVPDKDFFNLYSLISNALDLIIANRIENFDLAKTRDFLLPKLLNGEL